MNIYFDKCNSKLKTVTERTGKPGLKTVPFLPTGSSVVIVFVMIGTKKSLDEERTLSIEADTSVSSNTVIATAMKDRSSHKPELFPEW